MGRRKHKGKRKPEVVNSSVDTFEKSPIKSNNNTFTCSEHECTVSVCHASRSMTIPRATTIGSSLLDLTVSYDYTTTTGDEINTLGRNNEPGSNIQQLTELFNFKDSSSGMSHSCSSLWKDIKSHNPPPNKKSKLSSSLSHSTPFHSLCNLASHQLDDNIISPHKISKEDTFGCHSNTNPINHSQLSVGCYIDIHVCNHDNSTDNENSDDEADTVFWTQVATQVNESPADNKRPEEDNQVNERPPGDNQVNERPPGDNQVNERPPGDNQVNGRPMGDNQVNERPMVNDMRLLEDANLNFQLSGEDENDRFIDKLLMCYERPLTVNFQTNAKRKCLPEELPTTTTADESPTRLRPITQAVNSNPTETDFGAVSIRTDKCKLAKRKRWYSCVEIQEKREMALQKLAKKSRHPKQLL